MSERHDDAVISRQVRALETLLEDRGAVDGEHLDALIDGFLAKATPSNGARLVAKAWVNDDFRRRLLTDGNAAVGELGLSAGGLKEQVFRVLENTPTTHNIIVCTLCSCYPLGLLGPSPSWYKSEAYRSRVVREPRDVLREFGVELPDDVHVEVWDASAETRFMVLPRRPAGTKHLGEEQLVALVSRNGLIGTAHV